ncbi:glycosyltransferase family 39 protein [Hamadaea tsunoensis]|uniref:glycosyltransferase family 39 protein n=1 Tax=Hamadaea tsunoensis TaxID=53368 RepID=UPI0003F6A173|nr:glycosyltransferase family 39 protein [Hamadaea tsunoensis]
MSETTLATPDGRLVRPAVPGTATTPDGGPPQHEAATPTGWSRWRPSVLAGLWTWLAALGMYAVVTLAGWMPMQDLAAKAGDPPVKLLDAVDAWNRWDTTWYLIVADSGYHWDTRATAFYPGYPLLVRWTNAVLPGGSFQAGLVVAALACLAALIVIHRLAAEALDEKHARRTVFYLMAFPTGFYLVAAYNESLFIALTAASLYLMRRRLWWLAGLSAGLASGTRMAGVLIGVAFVYEYLRQHGWSIRKIRWDALSVLLVPSGLLAYMFYLWRSFGDPLYFLEAQKAWFHDGFQFPWKVVHDTFQLIWTTDRWLSPDTARNIFNLGTALLALALFVLAFVGPWKLGRENHYLVVFAALPILLPLSNPIHSFYPLSSMWRFALECIPMFMVLARMGRNGFFDRFYTLGAVGLQGVMIITFMQNNFVA